MKFTSLAFYLAVCPPTLSAAQPDAAGPAIVANHRAIFSQPPARIPSNNSTDAPLLGNGDFLAAFGGPPEAPRFYLCKADLWDLRPNGSPRSLARLDLDFPDMKGAGYRVEQDLLHATTTGVFKKDGVTLTVESIIAATENTLFVTLSAQGGSVAGRANLRSPDDNGQATALIDNENPVTIGREMHGGGRYFFDGQIADVVIGNEVSPKPPTNRPMKPETFSATTARREMAAPKFDKTVGVGAWIKINQATAEANYIVSKGEWNQAYSLGLTGGCPRFAINGKFVQMDKPLEAGKWHYLVGIFDGRALRLFVNGALAVGDASVPADGIAVVQRSYEKGMIRPTGAACALSLPEKTGTFVVAPGKSVTLAITASGLANMKDYRADAAKRASMVTAGSIATSRRAHEVWWADFWSKSFVEIPDKALEQRYYLSHYAMGCASRLAHFPPALYGWTLSEQTPMWGGAYFNNYNFFAPFYGLYAANHIEQVMPCNDAVIDALELGRDVARDESKYESMCSNALLIKNAPGILLPVSILPYGIAGAPTTWGQRTNASYGCVPLASTWYATRDPGFAKRAYPFVREVATFWEHFLVLENGRYVDKNDASLENSGRDTNPIVAMAFIRMIMDLATDMSTTLGVDRDRHAKWRDIRDHLSDYPQCTVGDLPKGSRIALPDSPETRALPIFRYSETGNAWQNDNAVGIQHIYPGNGIGLGTRTDLLPRAKNQIAVMARWVDLNGCNSFYPAAVRVGHEPGEILKNLSHWVATSSTNGMRADNPHGMEQFSTVPNTLQEMLLQSYDGTLRFFPNWPKTLDARFGTLRATGAFLVSAELKGGAVNGLSIFSEKGVDLAVQNPWPGMKVRVTRNGNAAETTTGERFTLKTAAGEKLSLSPE
ncbi:MAG: LamG-like jellyroll fold domain-containing protein [Luteolibacter sp.]